MSRVLIYTDPHIGLSRKANATPSSALARELETREALRTMLRAHRASGGLSVCTGDLFDRSSNPEPVVAAGAEIVGLTDRVLAGNHDVENKNDSLSSLELISTISQDMRERLVVGPGSAPEVQVFEVEQTKFFLVPHVYSQKLFIEALELAQRRALDLYESGEAFWGILCLHCNYNMPNSDEDVQLTLQRDKAHTLLSTFHHIVIGHDHVPKTDFDGRLIVLGSFRPTAFDNLTDKYTLLIDTVSGEVIRQCVWNKEEQVYSGKASAVPENKTYQYYDIEDDLKSGETQRKVVKLFKNGAFGVRVKTNNSEEIQETLPKLRLASIVEHIDNDLKAKNTPSLYGLWKYYLEKVRND